MSIKVTRSKDSLDPFPVRVRESGLTRRVLRFTDDEWNAFIKGIKAGEFDRLTPEADHHD